MNNVPYHQFHVKEKNQSSSLADVEDTHPDCEINHQTHSPFRAPVSPCVDIPGRCWALPAGVAEEGGVSASGVAGPAAGVPSACGEPGSAAAWCSGTGDSSSSARGSRAAPCQRRHSGQRRQTAPPLETHNTQRNPYFETPLYLRQRLPEVCYTFSDIFSDGFIFPPKLVPWSSSRR